MAQAVMLLCKYGMFTSVIHLSESMKYNDLMHRVCNKWKNLAVNMVCLTYALPGHPKCLLDNDLDLLSLSMLASLMGMGKNLAVNMVCLTYALPGHPKCLLDNDLDLLSLSMLASLMGMGRVDVFVSELQELKDDDQKDHGDDLAEDALALVDYEGTNMETDLLPQFCIHKEKILLSSGWASGIRNVGQRF
eukprot:TRINITY_DN15912_c0_g3_i2.p1 TRINITY_DN15912_c0_g3~~TRINITY_DN15912_c0_g3_i2.p1  ORF type:complete len:191 (-),score=27.76 TRINITY_DN15912_c0_g3_i2:1759-2331(-)